METERKATMIMESTRGDDSSFTINISIEGDFDAADAVGHICKLTQSFGEALGIDPNRMLWLCVKHCDKFFTEEGAENGVSESTGGG